MSYPTALFAFAYSAFTISNMQELHRSFLTMKTYPGGISLIC